MGIHYFFSSNFTPNNENVDCEYLFSKVCVEQKKRYVSSFFRTEIVIITATKMAVCIGPFM